MTLIFTADEWLAPCSMASILVFFKSLLNSGLWYYYPCSLKVVHDVTDCCFVCFFLDCSQDLCVTTVMCCFSWLSGMMPIDQYTSVLFSLGNSKLWYLLNVFKVPLMDFLPFFQLQNCMLFSHRHLYRLNVGPPFLTTTTF